MGLTVMVGMIVAIGCFSAWAIKRINLQYSTLVQRSVEDLGRVHNIVTSASLGYRSVAELASTSDDVQRRELLEQLQHQRIANDHNYEQLNESATEGDFKAALDELMASRAEFRREADRYVQLVQTNRLSAETDAARNRLLSSFIQYEQSSEKPAEEIRNSTVARIAELTQQVRELRLLVVALSVAPIILGLVLSAIVFYLIVRTPHEIDFIEA